MSSSRWLALAALASGACAAKTRDAAPLPVPVATAPSAEAEVARPAPLPPLPSMDELAARQVRLAPGMRELARGEATGSQPLPPLPKVERDTCVRVICAAQAPTSVALVARDGTALAASPASLEGVLGTEGPVCFHREAEPRLVLAGDAGTVRFVVWGAP